MGALPRTRPSVHGACQPRGGARARKRGSRAHLLVRCRTGRRPTGSSDTASPPGTGVATLANMNTTRTIDATFDLSTPAAAAHASTESPPDVLATKVFAATLAYVVIFITVTVLLIAL